MFFQEGGGAHRWVLQNHGGVQNFVSAHSEVQLLRVHEKKIDKFSWAKHGISLKWFADIRSGSSFHVVLFFFFCGEIEVFVLEPKKPGQPRYWLDCILQHSPFWRPAVCDDFFTVHWFISTQISLIFFVSSRFGLLSCIEWIAWQNHSARAFRTLLHTSHFCAAQGSQWSMLSMSSLMRLFMQ